MPTPISVGTTTCREVSVQEARSRTSFDTVTITLRGATSNLAAAKAQYRAGGTYGGYSNMRIETIDSTDRGPVCDLTLTLLGFIDNSATPNDPISITDDIAGESVTITTSADENVTFRYFAQTTSVRYIARQREAPRNTKYPGIVPSTIPTGTLFQPNPPNYTGGTNGRYRFEGRLVSFQRERIAQDVWAVVETWANLIEPVNPD